jgi:hypothetical protein
LNLFGTRELEACLFVLGVARYGKWYNQFKSQSSPADYFSYVLTLANSGGLAATLPLLRTMNLSAAIPRFCAVLVLSKIGVL